MGEGQVTGTYQQPLTEECLHGMAAWAVGPIGQGGTTWLNWEAIRDWIRATSPDRSYTAQAGRDQTADGMWVLYCGQSVPVRLDWRLRPGEWRLEPRP